VEPLDVDTPPPPPPKDPPRSSTINSPPSAFSPLTTTPPKLSPQPKHQRGSSAESDWDVVGNDDLPLRWATDYVPLTPQNPRLSTQSVLFFELHRCTDQGRTTARLAIATKQNILLYEAIRGERAFRFVKVRSVAHKAVPIIFVSVD
jgi:hypothetical protein